MADREAKLERERIAAARRAPKRPTVTRETVDALMAAITPEGRAAVAAMASYRLRGGIPK